MPALIATRRFVYGTRRLSAEDSFEATRTDATILVGLGKARYATRAIVTPEHKPAKDDAPVKAEKPQETQKPVESTQATEPADKPRRGRPPKSKVID